jgi:hypothetical protein
VVARAGVKVVGEGGGESGGETLGWPCEAARRITWPRWARNDGISRSGTRGGSPDDQESSVSWAQCSVPRELRRHFSTVTFYFGFAPLHNGLLIYFIYLRRFGASALQYFSTSAARQSAESCRASLRSMSYLALPHYIDSASDPLPRFFSLGKLPTFLTKDKSWPR